MTPSLSSRIPGAWSPDVIRRLECIRHGQHDAISAIEKRCQLCHDANRPGVIERRYVDVEQVILALQEEGSPDLAGGYRDAASFVEERFA